MRVLMEWVMEVVAKDEIQQGLRTVVLHIRRFRYKAFSASPPHLFVGFLVALRCLSIVVIQIRFMPSRAIPNRSLQNR